MAQNDIDYAKELFAGADLEISAKELDFINTTLANKWQNAFVSSLSTLYSSRLLEKALNAHAKALVESAEASEKHAESLNRATRALFFATVIMAIATVVIAIVGVLQVLT